MHEMQREQTEKEFAAMQALLGEHALNAKAAEAQLRGVETLAKKAAQSKGISLLDITDIVERYQKECSKSVLLFSQQLGEQMKLVQQNNADLKADNSAVFHKYERVDEAVQKNRYWCNELKAGMKLLNK